MTNESKATTTFLAEYFSQPVLAQDEASLTKKEKEIVDRVLKYVEQRFSTMKYILGLALDFTLLAQKLSAYNQSFKITQDSIKLDEIFSKFQLVKRVGSRAANTLSLTTETGERFGIRKIEEQVVDFFHGLHRSAYPSAYVYNTGQWRKFEDLLVLCFSIGENARSILAKKLIQMGLTNLTKNSFWTRGEKRPRVFERVIEQGGFQRTFSGQNGGLILQAAVYGFFKSDRPHLDFVVDKVRTGSSRQHRFGDIDAYYGADLELTSEVKDLEITTGNLDRQCGAFIKSCQTYGVQGIVACDDVTEDARQEILSAACSVLTLREIEAIVSLWDWPKQDSAFCSSLHYVSHVEQDADATLRLLRYVESVDPMHSMLAFLPK